MKIQHTFKGMLSGEIKTITEDNQLSPNTGYTQRYAEQCGKDYEEGRAEELLGSSDYWEWQSSTYLR